MGTHNWLEPQPLCLSLTFPEAVCVCVSMSIMSQCVVRHLECSQLSDVVTKPLITEQTPCGEKERERERTDCSWNLPPAFWQRCGGKEI